MEENPHIQKKRFRLSVFVSLMLVVLMWAVHLLNISMDMDLNRFGVHPREVSGLWGILFSPLLHGDWQHLVANSMSFVVLATGLFYFYPKIGYRIFTISWITVGIVVWIMARQSYHIGASGVIYAMAGFLFLSGIIRKDFRLMAVSLIIVFMYGSMIWGIFPGKPGISWEAHFAGLFMGFILAWIYRKQGPKKPVYSWETEEDTGEEEPPDRELPNGYHANQTYWFEDVEIHYPDDDDDSDENKKQ
ncbi:MAG: rhomboid family intramembrane serine protease [Candidatus Delongbacteria bacterium]|jgi:membrane associated rhomboid family serine protease|nr:rhomboid family intramembrane serine protease [Candidatus Delongbacteria bacterium]